MARQPHAYRCDNGIPRLLLAFIGTSVLLLFAHYLVSGRALSWTAGAVSVIAVFWGGLCLGSKTTSPDTSRLRSLFTQLTDGIIVMDGKRIITYINPAATKITGWELGDIVPYCLFCQQRPRSPGNEQCLLAADRSRHYFESQLPTKDGDAVTVGMSRTFLAPSSGSTQQSMVILIRDVTIEKQEEELALSRHLTQHTLMVQEEERKRLSQDLHDGLSQTLYGISLGLESLSRQIGDADLKKFTVELSQNVRTSLEEVRSLSRSLYPVALDNMGLVAALRALAYNLSTAGRTVRFLSTLSDDTQFDSPVAVQLYRIVQEAVHNAIRHGQASQINIQLFAGAQGMVLEIRDDGVGFLTTARDKDGGYGLRNMQERARAIGATLKISSLPRQGTEVAIEIQPTPVPDPTVV